MSQGAVLHCQGLSAAWSEELVLAGVDLSVPARGVTTLLGPAGTGKSTLLRIACGIVPRGLRTWGTLRYLGAPGGERGWPALVRQQARSLLEPVLDGLAGQLSDRERLTRPEQRARCRAWLEEHGEPELAAALDVPAIELTRSLQRRLVVLAACLPEPALLCLDEPTAELEQAEAAPLLQLLQREAARRALLLVTHQQDHARTLGGQVVLLAGGAVQEAGPTEDFFAGPRSAAGREFLRTGSCALPRPGTPDEELEPEAARARAAGWGVPVSAHQGPTGFRWLIAGRLAGTPQPGLLVPLEQDLAALRRVAVTLLVSLTEQPPPAQLLRAAGIDSLWFPIVDMAAPGLAAAARLCAELEARLARGAVIAVHCRAGLGRTGTILAAFLIRDGLSPQAALQAVRRVEAGYVQSEAQLAFLERFAAFVRSGEGEPTEEWRRPSGAGARGGGR